MMAGGELFFTCDECGRRYRWKQELAGRASKCHRCGSRILIPMAPEGTAPMNQASAAPAQLRTAPSAMPHGSTFAVPPAPAAQMDAQTSDEDEERIESLHMDDIFKVMFESRLVIEAVVVSAVSLLLLFAIYLAANFLPCIGGLVALIGMILYLGWLSVAYLAIIRQFRHDTITADEGQTTMEAFGYFIAVSAIAWGPLFVLVPMMNAVEIGSDTALRIAVFAICLAWGVIYWPMGIAVAAVEDRLSPLRVFELVRRQYGPYFALLLFVGPLVFGGMEIGSLIQFLLLSSLPDLVGQLLATATGWTISQYVIVAMFGILGCLMRREALNFKPARNEMVPALVWIGSAFAIFIAVMVVSGMVAEIL